MLDITDKKVKAREVTKLWRINNPEKYQKLIPEIIQRQKDKLQDPQYAEAYREKERSRYQKRIAKLKESGQYKEWLLKARGWASNRRKRLYQTNDTSYLTVDTVNFIFERDNYACLKCGATEKLSIDHIVPLVLGGSSDRDNLQTLCRSCNSSKRTKIEDYRKVIIN